ncbi:hypothetical protein NYR97_06975 [Xanthomonas hydrangeae]|uniref:Type III secretion protein HrpB7 n=1 Tax=Xanthomonas hydrangeae TaxID=2775159 RepID=A0AAU0BGU0_9XANT|nr:hypothetical protein [Xanthomonas hydrangeae]WOB51111.1 hypothetical protein NYR97_06975 [Xanthomonas hydrangeae]
MSDDHARRQLQRLTVLVRVRDLQTRKASLVLQSALLESRQAQTLLRECEQRVHAVACWKQRAENGLLQLQTYQAALDVEAVVHAEQTHALRDADACDDRVDAARTTHCGALAEERSVDERHQRLSEQTLRLQERAESDTCAELWLARKASCGN